MKKLNKEEMRQLYMLRQDLGTVRIRIEKVKNFLDKKGWGEKDSIIDEVEYEAKELAEEVLEIERENEKL
ncbi:MAG: hypothetical protein IJJ98_11095 [Prevotella sp.]|nr:hypothetical protein [Prevotella sp.]